MRPPALSVYSGAAYPKELDGAYFFTDIVDGEVYAADRDDPSKLQYITDIGTYGPANLVAGADGMLMVDMLNGRILRLDIAAPKLAPE